MTRLLSPDDTSDRQMNVASTSPGIVALNQGYLSTVRRRALCDAATVNSWQGQTVRVFLRHETDHVFAIAGEQQFGMADYVAIEDARFIVDEPGRQEACRGAGILPNGRNVHAFVTGRLLWAEMDSSWTVPEDWQPIVYNPHRMASFQVRDSGQAIDRAARVVFTPRPLLVRCQVPSEEQSTEAHS